MKHAERPGVSPSTALRSTRYNGQSGLNYSTRERQNPGTLAMQRECMTTTLHMMLEEQDGMSWIRSQQRLNGIVASCANTTVTDLG